MDNDAYLKSGRPCHCRLRAGALLKKGPARLCVPAFFVRRGGAAVVRGAAIAPTAGPGCSSWPGRAGGDSFSILLQVLAIAFVAQLAADLCREAGLAAAAFCMEFVGRILAMLQALPLLQSLLASFLSFLS